MLGGLAASVKVIRVSAGTARHSAVSLAGPGPTITPPGFTPLNDGRGVAAPPPRLVVPDAGPPDAAVPVPATVVPQAAATHVTERSRRHIKKKKKKKKMRIVNVQELFTCLP